MNNTKWTEIFEAFYYGSELVGGPVVPWTTKSLDGDIYSDNTWTHFGVGMEGSKEIDWLRIKLTPENREVVLKNLRAIHVPGEVVGDSAYVYGHRMDVDYI